MDKAKETDCGGTCANHAPHGVRLLTKGEVVVSNGGDFFVIFRGKNHDEGFDVGALHTGTADGVRLVGVVVAALELAARDAGYKETLEGVNAWLRSQAERGAGGPE